MTINSNIEGGKCQVPMWSNGTPDGFCGNQAYGHQLPFKILFDQRTKYVLKTDVPYCFGPCCPAHGGPKIDEPKVYKDGLGENGRPMWCAVFPDFINLQESPAAFHQNPLKALKILRALPKEPTP